MDRGVDAMNQRDGERRDQCVYVHRDEHGSIFYVGKGSTESALSTDRHMVWHRYVDERLGGKYTVDIVDSDLSESEAEDRCAMLTREYGSQIVTWSNFGRQTDFEALERYHALRDANRAFVAATKPLEMTHPADAIERYRKALQDQREYESIVTERGIVAEMMEGVTYDDPGILDRLTLCLVRAGRRAEAKEEFGRYFAEFPYKQDSAVARRIRKRVSGSHQGARVR